MPATPRPLGVHAFGTPPCSGTGDPMEVSMLFCMSWLSSFCVCLQVDDAISLEVKEVYVPEKLDNEV